MIAVNWLYPAIRPTHVADLFAFPDESTATWMCRGALDVYYKASEIEEVPWEIVRPDLVAKYGDFAKQMKKFADWQLGCWQTLRAAWSYHGHGSIDRLLINLSDLREQLGDDNFFAGRMPTWSIG